MPDLAAACMIGLAGSLHCVAMCGPLILAMPWNATSSSQMMTQSVLYHTGRIAAYTLLGLLFGLLGKGIYIAGFQQFASMAAGIFLLATAWLLWIGRRSVLDLPYIQRLALPLRKAISQRMQQPSIFGYFILGSLNGLLPCGMTYVAVAAAIATSFSWHSGLFMTFFGLGTLPLLLIVTVLGSQKTLFIRRHGKFVQLMLLSTAALLLIFRGFNLDLSLFESTVPVAGFDCH